MARRAVVLLLLVAWVTATAAAAARIVAVGDIHGEIDGFDSILRAAGLTDEAGHWVGGDAVLVQTGDVTDRGARVREVMDRVRSLSEQAPAAGGRVTALLGNHEFSNLIHLFDTTSTPAAVYHRIWANFADDRSGKRQKTAYRQWLGWYRRYPGCVKQENRGWPEDRAAWMAAHPQGYVEYLEAISPAGDYGRWMRGLSVVAEVGGGLFLHGGISPELLERGYDSVEAINAAAAGALEQFDRDRQRLLDEQIVLPFSSLWEAHCALFVEMARLEKESGLRAVARRAELAEINDRLPGKPGWFPTEEFGPLWYRGLATGDEAELGQGLETILETFGVERIAVGHTPQPGGIKSRFGGRVFLIDTAMAYPELGGRAAALEIAGGRVTAIYADERVPLAGAPIESDAGTQGADGDGGGFARSARRSGGDAAKTATAQAAPATPHPDPAQTDEPPAPEPPIWLGPDGQPLPFTTVEEVLEFLSEAKVVRNQGIGTGVTLPRKLTLERDGVRAHAIFHSVEIEKRRERLRGGVVINFFRDHYANNVAAFELSRMLGMTNVPPAVLRRVGRHQGSVQLWIEGSRTEADRRRDKIDPPGQWRRTARDMQVFDNLCNNIDRNQGNILFDPNWRLWFIDHTRAFGRLRELPKPERVKRCSRRLFQALEELDADEVKRRLGPYLGIYEIQGLMARRDLLVELIEERIAKLSEAAVLFDYDQPHAADDDEDPAVPEAPPGSTSYSR